MADIQFGNGSYSKELWIHGGQLFTNPTGVDVESVNAGAFALEVVDANGAVKAHNVTQNAHGGWTSWDIPSLGVYNGQYKLRFVNTSAGTRLIKQGTVRTK